MPLILAPGLSFCDADGSRIFLDIGRDRYFCLGAAADAAFSAVIYGESATADRSGRLSCLVSAGILVEGAEGRAPQACREVAITTAPLDAVWPKRPRGSGVLAAAFAIERAKLALRVSGLAKALARLEAIKRSRRCELRDGETCELTGLAITFAAAGRIVSAFDQCLPLSFAVLRRCLADRIAANLVLGVKLRPFQAHAWVVAGDTLLSDRLATVRQFTPILVL